jgi:hypothetical protein
MSTLCGLTKQDVLNWRENGLPPVAGGLFKNLKMVDGKLVECGWPVGEHPSETAGGNNFSNLLVLHWACLTLFNNEDLSVRKLAAGIESIQLGQIKIENWQLELKNGLKTVSFRLDAFEEKSQPTARNKVSGSNTDHGQSIHDSLLLSGNIRDAPEGEGPAIILPRYMAPRFRLNTTRNVHMKMCWSTCTLQA